MTEIRFYHLEASRVADEAPKLLEKAYATGLKTLVRCPDDQTVSALDKSLWTYDPASFLPHGTVVDKAAADQQPVYLTDGSENPNEAKLLLMVDGAVGGDADQFDRCFYMFNGSDDSVLAKARNDWKHYKDQGFDVSYWQKDPNGKWSQKA